MMDLDQHARNMIDTTYAYLAQALDKAGSSMEAGVVCMYVLESLDQYVSERQTAHEFQEAIDREYEAAVL